MNEVLVDLFNRAGGRVEGNLTYTDEGFDPKVFAELIIRQSARVADMVSENKTDSVGDNIMIYFGVEV